MVLVAESHVCRGGAGEPSAVGVSWIKLMAGVLLVALLAAGCATRPGSFPIAQVAPGIFMGHKPCRDAHFNDLRAHGVHTILNLEEFPWDIWPELCQARRNDFQYFHIPILALPISPSEKNVKQALLILNDLSLRPIFVHCFLGEDRSTFIIGLYRAYYEGWTPQAAWEAMLRSGFHDAFRLRGLSSYFWHHTQKPAWAGEPP
jgi:hypothetical protein